MNPNMKKTLFLSSIILITSTNTFADVLCTSLSGSNGSWGTSTSSCSEIPDVGPYVAAETMGNTLFTMRLEDREGASRFQNLEKDNGNVWIRTYGSHNKFQSLNDQLKTKGNSFVTQIGTGLVTLGEEDQYNLGVMAGYTTVVKLLPK